MMGEYEDVLGAAVAVAALEDRIRVMPDAHPRVRLGADRVADDVASSVVHAPAMFFNGRPLDGGLDAEAVRAAVGATGRQA